MQRAAAWFLLALLLSGCARQGPVTTLAGSTSVQPLAEVLAEAYARAGGEKVRIQGGGSAAGIRAVREGVADVGAASRPLTAAEAEGLHVHTIAWDALVVIVHPANPVVSVTADEARRLFAGHLRRWPNGRPVRVVTREHGSGTREAMASFTGTVGSIDRRALVMNSNGAVRAAVASDPDAIGYVSLGALADGGVRAVRIGGTDPTAENVRTGRYPLSRPFLFLTRGESGFVRFALGPQGRAIVAKEGLVPPR